MEMLQNAVSWVEIPVKDFERAKKFYSAIYDYEMPEFPMEGIRMGILLYDQQNGGVGGAIVQGDIYEPSTEGPKVYLNGGEDLSTVLGRVEGAGGKIVQAKIPIGDGSMGHIACFQDSEGNHIWLHSMK